MAIKGVIFDFDGTLADTFPLIFLAFRPALRKFTGRDFTDKEISKYFGPSEDGILQQMVPEHWQAALEIYLAEYQHHHATHARLFPGMLDLLKQLRSEGLKLGIVTGKSRRTLEISLGQFHLREYFDALAAGSPERSYKDLNIRQMVAGWGFAPSEVIYTGDAGSDITAAREAGVVPVGVHWAPTANITELQAEDPAALFDDPVEYRNWLLQQL